MARRIKTLEEYGGCSQIDESEFNSVSSNDRVDYTCLCGIIVESKKRLIVARLNNGMTLLCNSCKNKGNRNSVN